MTPGLRLTIDRFEGGLAVVVTDDDQTLTVLREMLPAQAREGDVLRVSLEVDPAATAALRAEARAVQEDLKRTDPGGDGTL